MRLIKYLLYLLMCVLYVDGSHFRGGIITWKPIAPYQIEISYRVSFRTTYSIPSHFCNAATIQAGYLVNGEGSLVCTYEGFPVSIVSPMSYFCTDFSVNEDWTTGQRSIPYTFPSTSTFLRFSYQSCCWIPLVEGGNSGWILETTADVSIRQDTGKINTSPISAISPIVRIQKGCSILLHIPTTDDDQDIVKCRWATKLPADECGSVCQTLSGSKLQEMPCALQYTASGRTGWYGVALKIEDFSYSMPTKPLSSVALQFLVYVFSSTESCQSKPTVSTNNTSNSPIVKILLNSTFFQTIVADSGSTIKSITSINTNSPIGLTKSELHKVNTGGTEWYINVTWTPSSTQTGSHIFCYWAVNSNTQSSDQVCQTLYVAVCPTDMIANAARTSTGELPGDTVTYTCNKQHELTSGNLTRTCNSDGTWTETAPFCTIMCLDPDVVLNAVETQIGDNPNDTVTYQCNTQYELTSGDLVRTCQNNGTWSGTPPTCTIMCQKPDDVVNASKTLYGDNPGENVTYVCNKQHKVTSGNLTRICQPNGVWGGNVPICTIMCPEPVIVNNSVKSQTGDNPGDIVTYKCNAQYEVTSGDLVQTCQTSGNWNGKTPICTIMCQEPVIVNNSVWRQTGDNPGDTVTYACNLHYEVTSGDLVRTCQSSGNWNGTAPICTIMCQKLDDVVNATKTLYGDNPGENVTYVCNKQHKVTSGNLTRICQPNGVWDGNVPICTIMCPEPVIVDNSVKSQTGDNPGDIVTYKCNSLYEVTSGDLVQTCQTSGNWNGKTPICTIMCQEPVIVNNSVHSQTGDNPGDTVTYACNLHYEVTSGDLVQTCQTSGNWNGTTPICTIMCQKPDDVVNATKTLYGDNPGENVTYVCNKQHKVTSGNLTRICKPNGVWDGNVPICTIICPEPVIVNNSVTSQTGNNPGDIVRYKCNSQYEVTSGDLVQTCQTSGNWSGKTPICTIMCPEPFDVLNASKTVYGDNPGENVTYTCDEQHELTSGNLTRTCQHSGLWDGDVPVCTIKCPQPEDVYKANKTYTGDNPDDSVTYICEQEENYVIGTYSRTCLLNGSWSSVIPGCMCDPPPIVSNAVWERNGSTAYLKCNDGFYSKGNLQIHCSVNSSWTSLTDNCYKESSIGFLIILIIASLLGFGVLTALIASAAVLLTRKPPTIESDTENYFNNADAANLVPMSERF